MSEVTTTTNDGLTKAVWIHLLREGGRWSCAEVAGFLKVSVSPVSTVLANMCTCGSVVRFEKTGTSKSRVRFGVTTSCHVPREVTLEEVIQLSGVRA